MPRLASGQRAPDTWGMRSPGPDLDPVALESALLEAAPHPARSRAMQRWSLLRQLLGAADLVAGLVAGVVTAAALALTGAQLLLFACAVAVGWAGLCFASGLSAR